MMSTLRNFLAFSGEENRKKFIISIWLGALEAFGNALKVPAVMLVLMGLMQVGDTDIRPYIVGSVACMVVSIVIGIATKARISVLETEAGYGCCAFKRIEMAEHLRFVPMGYFNDNTIGAISSVMTNTMDALSNSATRVIMVTTQGILETLLVIVFLLAFDWRIGLIGCVGLGVFLLVNRQLQRSGGAASERKQAADTELVSQIVEYLEGIAEVKSYGLLGSAARRIEAANDAARDANTRMELGYDPWFLVQGIVIRLTGVAIVGASVAFWLGGTMDVLVVVGMTVCAFILFSGLEMYGSFSALLHLIEGYMQKANEVLGLPTMDIDGRDIVPESKTIEFHDVTFAYGDRKIIDEVSLTIPEGRTTALVGPSGSGKTTLAHLAARFWDVDAGCVTLGGTDVREYSFDSLMDNFSFVFQNVYLFSDTIENNIKFGREGATHEDVVRAARLACCDEFIRRLPDGYDTVIGAGGASLSGGERQRISIARAIMKDAPIIVLDEATANVDPENEEALMQAITELTRGKTVLKIAHRLKTVRDADQIVVIDQGKVADTGTHDELMQRDGIYRTFVEAREQVVNWQIR